MSRAPFVFAKAERPYARGDQTAWDTTLGWRFPNPRLERACSRSSRWARRGRTWRSAASVSREDQDAFALESQRRWAAADEAGPLRRRARPGRRGRPRTSIPGRTRAPRSSPRCKPAFRDGGTVTAGNSSGVNDGAAALVVASEERAQAPRRRAARPLRGERRRRRRSAGHGDRAGSRRAQGARARRASRRATSTSSS